MKIVGVFLWGIVYRRINKDAEYICRKFNVGAVGRQL